MNLAHEVVAAAVNRHGRIAPTPLWHKIVADYADVGLSPPCSRVAAWFAAREFYRRNQYDLRQERLISSP